MSTYNTNDFKSGLKILLDKEALASGLLRTGMQVTATVSTKPDCE